MKSPWKSPNFLVKALKLVGRFWQANFSNLASSKLRSWRVFLLCLIILWGRGRSKQNVRLYSSAQPSIALRKGLDNLDLDTFHVPRMATHPLVQLVLLAFSWLNHAEVTPSFRQAVQLKHSRGEEIFLDWFSPLKKEESEPETIIVYLAGITGELNEAMKFIEFASQRGWTTVVFHRRGHAAALRKPTFNVFGFAQDLREVIEEIKGAAPTARICLVGSSAGSAVMVRYLGESGEQAGVVAAVGISPGYDLRNLWHPIAGSLLDKYLLQRLKQFFFERNRTILTAHNYFAASHLESARTVHDFVEKAVAFSSDDATMSNPEKPLSVTFEEWLRRTCPLRVADGIRIPTLCLNARDDPICRKEMIDDIGIHIPGKNEHCALIMTNNGWHCAFQSFHRGSFSPSNWGYTIALDFIEGIIK